MNNELFPQNPAVIPFAMGQIFHLFPVLRENSIGLVYGEQWAIAEVKEDNVELDVFPEEEFECSICKALNQKSNSMLFVRSPKSVLMLDWNSKKLEAEFMDFSKSSGIGIENTKVIDHSNGIVLSLFFHDDKNMDFHYYFVIDDIFNRKRLKEVPIPKHIPPLDVFLTPSFVFYQYVWEDFESPWIVLDNDLNETKHPLADLLNDYAKKMVFYASHDLVYISEPLEHALIIAYNQITKTDNLYLARWYKEPEIIPVPFDSSLTNGGSRLVKSPNNNTISPSGKWVYFATGDGSRSPDNHYLIYLDPQLPQGSLPPFKLKVEGEVSAASWVTKPEALVLYIDGKLCVYDLSRFSPEKQD